MDVRMPKDLLLLMAAYGPIDLPHIPLVIPAEEVERLRAELDETVENVIEEDSEDM